MESEDAINIAESKDAVSCTVVPEPEIAQDERPRHLFDYSEVVTMVVGKGCKKHYFAFDLPRLCEESTYFDERLHGNYREARQRHIKFGNINPHTVACMLYLFRGWDCPYCCTDPHHIIDAYVLSLRYCLPRFKIHLGQQMQKLLNGTASSMMIQGCIVHLRRTVKNDCDLLDSLLNHLVSANEDRLSNGSVHHQKADLKHLHDFLAADAKRVSNLQMVLGQNARHGTARGLGSPSRAQPTTPLEPLGQDASNATSKEAGDMFETEDDMDYDLAILGLDPPILEQSIPVKLKNCMAHEHTDQDKEQCHQHMARGMPQKTTEE
ncbi:hypothetical protein A1O1_07178 [Capronia coronata CBS 617.96]|uniref:BTB domain-containing protein n=1 Tax=Capronia coronata CBS 617.96 TaxID=1182541 RepID=W9Y1P3_9EURO|nr:uncharacterized protein A1O1_07178 [Capronia coronata CBS 617.96]EXJ83555.1 hypothetical protein A1O1_07178 [Capronia coronata CBS 617.96]